MKNSIRVTYSGLISFAIGITSVLTGIMFTLIVTRTLSLTDFGTWNLIGGLVTYVVIVEPIISYWATREIARGVESGRTAVLSSGVFSIGGILVYLLISYLLSSHLHVNQDILLFSSILVPTIFLNRTLNAVNLGWKPQATSYGMLVFEASKIPSALIFVYFLHMGIFGAIISICIAYIASIVILLYYARDKIRSKIKLEFLKKWANLSWLSFYPGVSDLIYHLDVVIFSSITGSVIGLAFYSVSQTISNVVGNSSLIAKGVYPKLLEGGKKEYLQENLIRFFYFAIPLSSLSIVFARPALFALNPVYQIAVLSVIFMTVRAFLYVLQGIFSQALLGIETVDINEQSRFRDFVKSKLFFVPSIVLIQYTCYILVLTVGLLILKSSITSNIDLVNYWTAIALATQIPFTAYFYLKVRKHFTLSKNSHILLKYTISSIISFGIIYFFITYFLSYKRNIFEFIPSLLLLASIGIGMYLLITYAIDIRTRDLFKSIIREICGKSGKS